MQCCQWDLGGRKDCWATKNKWERVQLIVKDKWITRFGERDEFKEI